MNREEKIQKAKEFLGSRYLLHPSQRVKRRTAPIPSDRLYQVKESKSLFKPKPNL